MAVQHIPVVHGFLGTPDKAPAAGPGSQVGRAVAMSKSNHGLAQAEDQQAAGKAFGLYLLKGLSVSLF